MSGDAEAITLGAGQVVFIVALAPLLQGMIRRLKARIQRRTGPPLLQSYFDLAKLFARPEMRPEVASLLFVVAPWVALGSTLAAALYVPMFAAVTPITQDGDLLVVIGLFALGRVALTLGAIDSGGTFGQMGSSRELAVGALVEPALLLSLAALALTTGTARLGEIAAAGADDGAGFIDLQWGLALIAFATVTLAETGRIPFDNPDTHLELTMTHEAMLLEYSGRTLGVLHLAAMTKQLVLACLLATVFFSFGLKPDPGFADYVGGAAMLTAKVALAGVGLAITESTFAKMRLYELPDLIGSASLAGLVAMAITAWQL